MKVAIVGSRGFDNYEQMKQVLSAFKITLIISGGAIGADKLAERYAKEHSIPTMIHLPDWKQHGPQAGFIRNTDIINDAELVIAFWDMESKGTLDSIKKAEASNKSLLVINTNK